MVTVPHRPTHRPPYRPRQRATLTVLSAAATAALAGCGGQHAAVAGDAGVAGSPDGGFTGIGARPGQLHAAVAGATPTAVVVAGGRVTGFTLSFHPPLARDRISAVYSAGLPSDANRLSETTAGGCLLMVVSSGELARFTGLGAVAVALRPATGPISTVVFRRYQAGVDRSPCG